MANQVYMNVPKVRDIAKTFGTIGDVLKTVATVLETLATVLKATAFMGLVGGLAVAHFLDTVKPYIKQVADKCLELKKDLTVSVDAFERGDALGATRFY